MNVNSFFFFDLQNKYLHFLFDNCMRIEYNVIIQSNFTLYIPPGTSYYDKEVIIMALTGEDLAEISKIIGCEI